jgi:hypothetical protein
LHAKAKFLQKTVKKRLLGDLFVVYDGQEEDLHKEVEAFLDDEGNATFTVPLYYGNAYYSALGENPGATCKYQIKNIRHIRGKNTIDSEYLEMPKTTNGISLELIDDKGNCLENERFSVNFITAFKQFSRNFQAVPKKGDWND